MQIELDDGGTCVLIKGSYGYRICNAEDQGKELRKADRYVEVHAKPVRYSAKLTIAIMHGKSA
ncbi:MAG: hypothetical protein PUF42_00415 [Firmicutes bacterium]|nr:hypothetical protein [Bacillota bacterium]